MPFSVNQLNGGNGFALTGDTANPHYRSGYALSDADDRIVYNAATGQLFFDADGNGGGEAVLFATLDGHPPPAAGDFIVI